MERSFESLLKLVRFDWVIETDKILFQQNINDNVKNKYMLFLVAVLASSHI